VLVHLLVPWFLRNYVPTNEAFMGLSAKAVEQAKPKAKQYKLTDEHGLYLLVTPNGARYWRWAYRFAGKQKTLALGVFPEISLKEARKKHAEGREELAGGEDPSAVKKARRQALKRSADNSFKAVALEWLEVKQKGKSEGYNFRVRRMMESVLFPAFGNKPIGNIDAADLLDALSPVQYKGLIDKAHRCKQIAGMVLRYAVATRRAERDYSRDLDGALAENKTKHFAAIIDPQQFGKLLLALDQFDGSFAVECAVKLSPHVFTRPGELRKMEWRDVDFDRSLWEIPADKKKEKRDHVVPLSKQAVSILSDLHRLTGENTYAFPSARGASRPMSENAVRVAIRSLGYDNGTHTPHGFRTSARTMLHERLNYRPEVIEKQLAHKSMEKLGDTYDRTLFLDERVKMMQAWSDYMDQLKAAAGSPSVVTADFTKQV
jgi:integrase